MYLSGDIKNSGRGNPTGEKHQMPQKNEILNYLIKTICQNVLVIYLFVF